MSINPIELLRQKVSSVLLNTPDGLAKEKSVLLSKFYPIFLSILVTKPNLIQKLKYVIVPSLSDLLEQNDQAKNVLLTNLVSGRLTTFEAEQIINQAIPKCLAALTSEAGNDTPSIIHYLEQYADSIRAYVSEWAVALLTPLGLITSLSASESNLINTTELVGYKNYLLLFIFGFTALVLFILWLL
ncbi:MAG: hypothetical protein I8H98_08825 [Moraxellaceae bacterium]|uniref:Uncharacterized protein n=1 Tax=Acinetobacter tjernbergiae DSM 14971 = CIP 107465 TaxID=1120928 RepID=V2V6G4_9GAMM|nr:hypothetical protein F990_01061 [Acinetobacter tjernbergiae DSM 14971 = CIP 107465]MBH2002352.1 hypothetical protein [Moraxellaceae bacterium]